MLIFEPMDPIRSDRASSASVASNVARILDAAMLPQNQLTAAAVTGIHHGICPSGVRRPAALQRGTREKPRSLDGMDSRKMLSRILAFVGSSLERTLIIDRIQRLVGLRQESRKIIIRISLPSVSVEVDVKRS